MNGCVQIWPFLYTRTREVDYGFVVLPERLARDRQAVQALERALEQPAHAEGVELPLSDGTARVYLRAEPAELDGAAVKDKVGREILSFSGFVASGPLAKLDVDKAFASVGASFKGLTQLLWGERRRAPMLSLPSVVGEPVPGMAGPPQARPVRSFTPPWRALLELTLSLVAVGLLMAVVLLASALHSQRRAEERAAARPPSAPSQLR